jgi:hypothetical protein
LVNAESYEKGGGKNCKVSVSAMEPRPEEGDLYHKFEKAIELGEIDVGTMFTEGTPANVLFMVIYPTFYTFGDNARQHAINDFANVIKNTTDFSYLGCARKTARLEIILVGYARGVFVGPPTGGKLHGVLKATPTFMMTTKIPPVIGSGGRVEPKKELLWVRGECAKSSLTPDLYNATVPPGEWDLILVT